LPCRIRCRSRLPLSHPERTTRAARRPPRSRPASCLPSAWISPIKSSGSGRSEALGSHMRWIVTEVHEETGCRLHEWCWSTHERLLHGGRGPAHLLEHCAVDAARIPSPVGWCATRQGERDTDLRSRQALELLSVDHVIPRSR